MSSSVVSVPQFSTARILRPFSGWDLWYNGKSGNALLMFSEGGAALDEMAGQPNYVNSLVRGCSVSLGSQVALWLPHIRPQGDGAPSYIWVLSWRLRNMNDLARAGKPAHFPLATPTNDVYPVPAAMHTVIYNSAEPAGPTSPAVQNVYPEYFTVNSGSKGEAFGPVPVAPFVPLQDPSATNGTGYIQSSGLGYGASADDKLPTFKIVELCALGDDFTLGVYRSDGSNWDFAVDGSDYDLGNWLKRNTAAGVYGLYGVSP